METNEQVWSPSRHGDRIVKASQRNRLRCWLATTSVVVLATTALSFPAKAFDAVQIIGGPPAWLNTGTVVEGANVDATAIITAINAMSALISQDLLLHSGQQTANSTSQIQANSQLMDTQDARETARRITDVRIRAATSSAAGASVCNVITGTIAAQNVFGAPSQWREEIISQQLNYVSGAMGKDRQQSIEQRNNLHCAVGATAMDTASGLCSSVTSPVQTTETGSTVTQTVGRDLSATVLLDPNALTLTSTDKAAANAFVLNVFGSVPLAAMPLGSATATAGHESSRRLAADNNSSIAMASVSGETAAWLLAGKSALPGTGGTGGTDAAGAYTVGVTPPAGPPGSATPASSTAKLIEWAEGTAKDTITYNPAGNNFSNGISSSAYMKLRSMAWFWNANWLSAVGNQSGDQTLKDIAYIEAWRAYQGSVQIANQERISLLLATMLHIMETQSRASH